MNVSEAIIKKGKLRKDFEQGHIDEQTLATRMQRIESKINRVKKEPKGKTKVRTPKIKNLPPDYYIPKMSEVDKDLIKNNDEIKYEQSVVPKLMLICFSIIVVGLFAGIFLMQELES